MKKDYKDLDAKASYVPFSADVLKQMWVFHERAVVDWDGYKLLERALSDAKSGRQPLVLASSTPIVLLNIELVEDIIAEHKRSCVCYEGMKYIGWILEQYEPKAHLVIPEEPNSAMKEAFLDGKVLPAYVGSERVALEPFVKAYNLVIETAKKAASKVLS